MHLTSHLKSMIEIWMKDQFRQDAWTKMYGRRTDEAKATK